MSAATSIGILDLPVSISTKRTTWLIILKCKNDHRDHSYDFSDFGRRYPSIVSAFMDAFIAKRNSIGHSRRKNIFHAIGNFLDYLDTLQPTSVKITELSQINNTVLSNFVSWSELNKGRTALTKAYQVGALKPSIDWLRRNHPDADKSLSFNRNMFPMAHRSIVPRKPYSSAEWNALLKAIAVEIKESKARLETAYVPNWLGKSPPLDDVAPFDSNKPPNVQHSMWESTEYVIWWWENLTQCQRVNDYVMRRMGKSVTTGLRAISSKVKAGEFGPLQPEKSHLQHFYDWLGPEQSYVPRFIDQPCPIKYRNRFRKPEYLLWYWENVLDAKVLQIDDLRAGGHYAFISGVKALHGGILGFYDAYFIKHKVTYADLLPYILLLAVRTALNLSTITSLTIDSISPAPTVTSPDPNIPAHWVINWEKIRAFTKGTTIPTHALHDLMPVSVILRVQQITESYRAGKIRLWITERGEKMTSLKTELSAFIEKHKLTQIDERGTTQRFSLQISRIRPTIAMREYARTENMAYIQTLLGHRSMGMTVQYLTQMDNPVLRSRRGVHQEAMFLDLTGNGDVAVQLLEAHGLNVSVGKALEDINSEHHGMLTSCKNPRQSPQPDQEFGKLCSSDACLSCQNLVITNRDLHKYFCFLQYHDRQIEAGSMTKDAYDLATSEVKHVFTTSVLPKFRPETIEIARRLSESDPLPEWNSEPVK